MKVNKHTILANGVDELVVSGLPKHTLVEQLNAQPRVPKPINCGEFVFATDEPGYYSFQIDMPGGRDFVTVRVIDQNHRWVGNFRE